jgi:hypothetical protein
MCGVERVQMATALNHCRGGSWQSFLAGVETHWKRWLICLTVAGFLLRLDAWSRFLCDTDSYIFMLMARNMYDHGTFSGTLGEGGVLFLPGTSILYKWLYPLIMAPLLAVTDPEAAGHLVSLACGVLFIPAMFFATRSITGDTLGGLIAAALACCSYSNASWSGHVLSESLCNLLLALGIWQGLGRGGTPSGALLGGLFYAAALLTRPEMAILFPAALLALLAASRRGIVLRAAAFCLGALFVLGPVSYVVMRDLDSPYSRAEPSHSTRKKPPAPWKVMTRHLDTRNIAHFCEEEVPLVISVLCAPVVLGAYRRRVAGRFAAYSAYHVVGLGGARACRDGAP